MPPCTWMLSCAHSSAAERASVDAMAAANESWSPPSAAARAASQTSAVASSAATSMLAQWCLTAWKVAMGRPNCTRTLAYAAACSVHSVAMPTASARDDEAGQVDEDAPPAGDHLGRRARQHDRARCAASGRGWPGPRPPRHPPRRRRRWRRRPRARTSTMGEATAQDRRSRPGGLAVRHRDVGRRARRRRGPSRRPARAAGAPPAHRARPRRSPRWRSPSARTVRA